MVYKGQFTGIGHFLEMGYLGAPMESYQSTAPRPPLLYCSDNNFLQTTTYPWGKDKSYVCSFYGYFNPYWLLTTYKTTTNKVPVSVAAKLDNSGKITSVSKVGAPIVVGHTWQTGTKTTLYGLHGSPIQEKINFLFPDGHVNTLEVNSADLVSAGSMNGFILNTFIK